MEQLENLFTPDELDKLAPIRNYLRRQDREAGLDFDIQVLLAHGSTKAVRMALEIAREFEDPVDRALAFIECAERAESYTIANAFRRGLEAAAEIGDYQLRAVIHDAWRKALGRNRTLVFGPAEDVLWVARAGDVSAASDVESRKFLVDSARVRGSFLARATIPIFSSHLRESLEVAEQLESDWGRANALTGISPYLPPDTTGTAVKIAESLTEPAPRARAFASIASRVGGLDRSESKKLFDEAFTALKDIGSKQQYGTELRYLEARAQEAAADQDLIARIRGAKGDPAEQEQPEPTDRPLILSRGSSDDGGAWPHSISLDSHRPGKAILGELMGATAASLATPRGGLDKFLDSVNFDDLSSELSTINREGATTNIAIAHVDNPEVPLANKDTLSADNTYVLLVDIGPQRIGRLAVGPAPSEEMVPSGRDLDVVLYSNDSDTIVEGRASAVFRAAEKQFVVKEVAYRPRGIQPHTLAETLFFRIKVLGQRQRESHLRLNFYYQGVLIQSRSITLIIGVEGDKSPISASMDFQLAQNLRPEVLDNFRHHDLCLMMNDRDDGSHGFHFFSPNGDKVVSSASVDAHAVQDTISHIRAQLRDISWGSVDEWDPDQHKYRYEYSTGKNRFLRDITKLAIAGKGQLDQITQRLTGLEQSELRKCMLAPGRIQLSIKDESRAVLPISTFYDFPLDIGRSEDDFGLCTEFLKDSSTPSGRFKESNCFKGKCPNYDDESIVCPAGFWGFRHEIGLPLSLTRLSPEHPNTAGHVTAADDQYRYLVAYYTGEDFHLSKQHISSLRRRFGDLVVDADSRAAAISTMTGDPLSLVYFYCHGGLIQNKLPYLHVGPTDDPKFMRTTISEESIRWSESRPVVFINGCHTTQVQPENAVELVSGFLEAGASAVTGTEITIFESLAVDFANTFLDTFLTRGLSFGASIKEARLALLESLNPLGLVYIPFGLGTLTLKPATPPSERRESIHA